MTRASIMLPAALLLGLAVLLGGCGKHEKNQQDSSGPEASDSKAELFPAPPAKAGWGQSIMDTLVKDLYGGSYDKALNAARTVAARRLEEQGAKNAALNIVSSALNQPHIGGRCETDGCIVQFDSNGEVTSGTTTKVLDFRTGEIGLPKPLSQDELKEVAPALKQYRLQLHEPGSVIIVFSGSFRDAAMIATLTQIDGTTFSVARQGEGACIVMTMDDNKVTLADDWIYS